MVTDLLIIKLKSVFLFRKFSCVLMFLEEMLVLFLFMTVTLHKCQILEITMLCIKLYSTKTSCNLDVV